MFRFASLLAASVALVALVACGAQPDPAAAEKEAAASQKAAEAPPAKAEQPMSTNGLTEAEFKALHVLKEGEAPALKGSMVEIGGGQHYLSLPAGEPPRAAVIVIHEWWGLNAHIKHWADRLAAEGYAALAVDLYGGETATTPDAAMAAMKAVDPAVAAATLEAAARWLDDDARVKATKTGVIGWCFGGAWSLQAGLKIEGLDAVVMYYGRTVTEAEALAGLDAPLLGIFARQDGHISNESVDAFEAALKTAGKTATIHRYDAKHAFANPSSGAYDGPLAANAWTKARAFLAQHLGQ